MKKTEIANEILKVAKLLKASSNMVMYCSNSLFKVVFSLPFKEFEGEKEKFCNSINYCSKIVEKNIGTLANELKKAGYNYVEIYKSPLYVIFNGNTLCFIMGGNLHGAQDDKIVSACANKAKMDYIPKAFSRK